jgi:hypothetical protein
MINRFIAPRGRLACGARFMLGRSTELDHRSQSLVISGRTQVPSHAQLLKRTIATIAIAQKSVLSPRLRPSSLLTPPSRVRRAIRQPLEGSEFVIEPRPSSKDNNKPTRCAISVPWEPSGKALFDSIDRQRKGKGRPNLASCGDGSSVGIWRGFLERIPEANGAGDRMRRERHLQ